MINLGYVIAKQVKSDKLRKYLISNKIGWLSNINQCYIFPSLSEVVRVFREQDFDPREVSILQITGDLASAVWVDREFEKQTQDKFQRSFSQKEKEVLISLAVSGSLVTANLEEETEEGEGDEDDC